MCTHAHTRIYAQIKGLDDELRKYQAQIKKTKGPAQANLKRRALDVGVYYMRVFGWRVNGAWRS